MPIRLLGFALFLLGMFRSAAADNVIITEQEISPGIAYLHKTVSDVPWSVHVLRIDRDHPDLQIVSTLPGGEYIGLTRLSDQVRYIPEGQGKPIGAINGDYFVWQKGPYQGDPIGMQIMNGELVSAPMRFTKPKNIRDEAAFWIGPDSQSRITFVSSGFEITWPDRTRTPFNLNEERGEGEIVLYNRFAGLTTKTTNGVELVLEKSGKSQIIRVGEESKMRILEIRGPNTPLSTNSIVLSIGPEVFSRLPGLKTGMTLTVSTATSPDLRGSTVAVGGGPLLVQDGKVAKITKDQIRHPRAALGLNEKYYFWVVVDGRRPGISDGMTYRELAREMASWNCLEAMSIDGGASAMLWIEGQIKNIPSEDRERPNANSLFVLRRDTVQGVAENKKK